MDFDLAIVGGGPAGIATALFLAKASPRLLDRVVVLEKERYPREKICAGAIGARAEKALAAIGVTVDVPSVSVQGLSVVTPGGSLVRRLDAPIGRVVRRIEFDAALAAQAKERGILVREGVRATKVSIDRDGVTLGTTSGDVRVRAVVGADGVGSFVRRAMGLPRGSLRAQVIEVDTPSVNSDPARDLLHFDVTDRSLVGYAWDFGTVVKGEALVCRGIYDVRLDATDGDEEPKGADVGARLEARLEEQGISREGLRFKRFAERGLALHEPVAAPRVMLVGEAAGIDPVLGEGIAQALLYGAVAGPYLARALASGDLLFADWRRELGRSRVGWDLAVRTRMAGWIYGKKSRPTAERWVTTEDLAVSGMRYFAGERSQPLRLAGAFGALARAMIAR